jgi:signal peptidase II
LKQAVPLNRYLVFFVLAIAIFAVDLATKSWVFNHWLGMPDPGAPPHWIWTGVFGFQTTLNEGALFGMGQGFWPLFSALALGAAIGILLWLFPGGAAKDWLLNIALGFITAGIFGNLYDRVGLPGLVWPEGYINHAAGTPVHAVRDFIVVWINGWPWPTFNVADSALVCGAGLLILHAFFGKSDVAEGQQA